ncbi:hypothetical protein H5410_042737 [Solanum commersonii]|uniref:Uncharacterized protein n=1 Tax=Solanum commersonii TaxID=4109 RepID=A0A9J5XX74_SOLCO|nr:hypothetical protein H5410_042737 [Solanum commersonii]
MDPTRQIWDTDSSVESGEGVLVRMQHQYPHPPVGSGKMSSMVKSISRSRSSSMEDVSSPSYQ